MKPKAVLAPLFLLIALLAAGPGQAQDDVKITATDLGHGIYMLEGRGGNMGLCVGEDGAFLIDDQMAPLTDQILAAIAEITDRPVEFVVNTHWHFDHTGGNENLGKAGAVLFAHENVRKRMSTAQFNEFLNQEFPASPAGALPVVTFTDGVTFHWNGETIRVFHVENAHTDGDAIVHFQNANVIHMGDIYFNGLYPFVDYDSGGTLTGVIDAVDGALNMIDSETRVIPGHGALSDKQGLTGYRDMLVTIRDKVRKAMARGKSLEEIQEMGLTAKWDDPWGGVWITPAQIVMFAYKDLTR